MFTKNTTNTIVKSVLNSVEFDKVSDLTKEQFTEILSTSIYDSLRSREFLDKVSKDLSMKIRSLR